MASPYHDQDFVDSQAPTQAYPDHFSDEQEASLMDSQLPTQPLTQQPSSPLHHHHHQYSSQEATQPLMTQLDADGQEEDEALTQPLTINDAALTQDAAPDSDAEVEERKSIVDSDSDQETARGKRSRSSSASSDSRARKSRSRSRSASSAVSRSRSKSRSRSRSASSGRSSGSENDGDEIGRAKKRVVRDAFGSDSSDNEDGERNLKSSTSRKRIRSIGDEDDDEDGSGNADGQALAEQKQADEASQQVTPEAEDASAREPDSDDEGRANDDAAPSSSAACDFDLMLEKRKSEMRRRRRKKDIELINDNDDAIARMIADMRLAAREDRDLNAARMPATKKISMLPTVMAQLKKADLQMAFVEANILSVLTDWLAPMPDKSLPCMQIRREILGLLSVLRIDDHSRLKESGIGKAVMYLCKHPKELRENKVLAEKIINMWSRPIFNLSTDFKTVSKEERMARDELFDVRRRQEDKQQEEDTSNVRPGDPGWSYRARVPQVQASTYVNRPEWTSTVDITRSQKKAKSRLDKHLRAQMEKKKNSKSRRAVSISIEGRKMAL